MRRFLWLTVCLSGALGLGVHAQQSGESSADAPPKVAVLPINGAISPATADYLKSRQSQAVADGAAAIVIELDTPGGLETAMRDMIQTILQSSVPVITWVSPEGARAASAGTYLLYASHVAAMAPATNLGAATPVQIGGGGARPAPTDSGSNDGGEAPGEGSSEAESSAGDASPTKPGEEKEAGSGTTPDKADSDLSASEKKAINDAVAFIRSLAEKRGRNADWAEEAVREGASLSADAAVERNVVDLIAGTMDELLAAVSGREISLASGATQVLALENATIQRYDPGWRYQFLAIITNPTVAYVLMMIGIYGLLLEGYSPGAILPGTVGVIALLMALYAFQLMPVNYAGLALIVVGIVLMIAEALAPSFGILGFGGLAAFVLGSIFLMDSDVPGYDINLGVIVGLSLSAALLLGITFYLLYRSRRARITTGEEGTLDGESGEITQFENGRGWVLVNGERWQCRSEHPLQPGQRVRIERHQGFTVVVAPEPESGTFATGHSADSA
ncbi:nodulation protein NfeD [Algiphilus sp. NNCM1]|uniref:NfeD family protein n=1 Tax=Algiphilus sp. TaxID=1872431 RepID=UPI001CA6A5AE|nr:nodulation protein NfeD [Algiphilus sp.]MBY8965985.1 nodulation protein NfeD [Algiphilus acroporae]MCI5063331.1 nodulation protein NfeD [Algiphilus sp.]MCI5105059.1 nodulation protein NfeD [Algiphilus sp.]